MYFYVVGTIDKFLNRVNDIQPGRRKVVTDKAFWMGRDVKYASELTPELRANADELLRRVNGLLVDLGRSEIVEGVNSGWRPPSVNEQVPHAATHSSHMVCKAVDLHDPDGVIDALVMAHPELLKKHRLNHEHPESTPGWCHIDDRDTLGYITFKV